MTDEEKRGQKTPLCRTPTSDLLQFAAQCLIARPPEEPTPRLTPTGAGQQESPTPRVSEPAREVQSTDLLELLKGGWWKASPEQLQEVSRSLKVPVSGRVTPCPDGLTSGDDGVVKVDSSVSTEDPGTMTPSTLDHTAEMETVTVAPSVAHTLDSGQTDQQAGQASEDLALCSGQQAEQTKEDRTLAGGQIDQQAGQTKEDRTLAGGQIDQQAGQTKEDRTLAGGQIDQQAGQTKENRTLAGGQIDQQAGQTKKDHTLAGGQIDQQAGQTSKMFTQDAGQASDQQVLTVVKDCVEQPGSKDIDGCRVVDGCRVHDADSSDDQVIVDQESSMTLDVSYDAMFQHGKPLETSSTRSGSESHSDTPTPSPKKARRRIAAKFSVPLAKPN